MPRVYKMLALYLPLLLMLGSLFSACESTPSVPGPLSSLVNQPDQHGTCKEKSLPRLTTLVANKTSAKNIYASSGSDIYAFDALNGATHWCQVSDLATSQSADLLSVTGDGQNLYLTTSAGSVAAYTTSSGSLLWHTETNESATARLQPVVVNHTLYTAFSHIYALNTQDGSILWQYALQDPNVVSTAPVVMNGIVYVSTRSTTELTSQVLGLDAITGKQIWTASLSGGETSLLASDGHLFFANDDPMSDNGQVGELDGKTGKVLWQQAFLAQSSDTTFVALTQAAGTLYVIGTPVSSTSFGLYALDAQSGNTRWSMNLAAQEMGAQLLVAQNNLYVVGTSGQVSALNPGNGSVLWQTALQGTAPVLPGQLTLIDEHLFVSTGTLKEIKPTFLLHALNISSHKEDWYLNLSADTTNTSVLSVSV